MKIHLRKGPFRYYPESRPLTREGCEAMARPCPFATCKWHLSHDAHKDRAGRPTVRVLNDSPWTMANTCALDDREWATEEIAAACGVTRQRVDQIIHSAQRRMSSDAELFAAKEDLTDGKVGTWWEVSNDQDEDWERGRDEEGDNGLVAFDWDFVSEDG